MVFLFFGICLFLATACGNGTTEVSTEETSSEETTVPAAEPEELFTNDYAKVLKVNLAPGATLAAHQGNARVIYSLNDYSIEWEAGAVKETETWQAGAVHFHEANLHSATNTGSTNAEWLAFVRNSESLPEAATTALDNDVNTVGGEYVNQLFDNENFRITEVTLPAGAKLPMHSGTNRVIYSLSDYQIRFESEEEDQVEETFQVGDVHAHKALAHALENIGQSEARFLVVAYK